EYVIWQRLSGVEPRVWRRVLLELEWRKMRRHELEACARVPLTIAVSEKDRRLLADGAPAACLRAIPTGVDTAYFTPNVTREVPGHLVFTGSMDWYPNEDGVVYFIKAILPGIRHEMPQTSFTIVGRNPSRSLEALARRSVVLVTGRVDDIRPHVAEAAV